ncbi:hypothetical protein YC2023_014126 [Brassica napus]
MQSRIKAKYKGKVILASYMCVQIGRQSHKFCHRNAFGETEIILEMKYLLTDFINVHWLEVEPSHYFRCLINLGAIIPASPTANAIIPASPETNVSSKHNKNATDTHKGKNIRTLRGLSIHSQDQIITSPKSTKETALAKK